MNHKQREIHQFPQDGNHQSKQESLPSNSGSDQGKNTTEAVLNKNYRSWNRTCTQIKNNSQQFKRKAENRRQEQQTKKRTL